MLANLAGYGLIEPKPGSATRPVPGFDIRIVDEQDQELGPGEEGNVVIRLPLPPGCLPTLWGNDERFISEYLSAHEGCYTTGDGGYIDEDGYVFITGRIDDVINVAGHRLSTADIEEVVAAHESVAECAVVGFNDELKGQVPVGFVVLKAGVSIAPEVIEKALIQMVRDRVGALANFKKVAFVDKLPKTRSGKILRKFMRMIADGKAFAMPSTIEDPQALETLKHLINSFNYHNLEVALEGHTLMVSMNRKVYGNAINLSLLNDLKKLLHYINTHEDVRSVILTSSDADFFSSGLDFAELNELSAEELWSFSREAQTILKALRDCQKPIVAAINGEAQGSALELVLACHFRVAAKGVKMGFPGAALGLVPGLGGTQRLTLMVGKARAMELLLTGAQFTAEEAKELGLINHAVDKDALLPFVRHMLEGINRNCTLFNESVIRCLNAAVDRDRDGFAEESEAFRDSFLHSACAQKRAQKLAC
jgi:enoyl-CoA hydratase/carnithine racemase